MPTSSATPDTVFDSNSLDNYLLQTDTCNQFPSPYVGSNQAWQEMAPLDDPSLCIPEDLVLRPERAVVNPLQHPEYAATYQKMTQASELGRIASAMLGRQILVVTPTSILNLLEERSSKPYKIHEASEIKIAQITKTIRLDIELMFQGISTAFRNYDLITMASHMPTRPPFSPVDPAISIVDQLTTLFHEVSHLLHPIGLSRHEEECFADAFSDLCLLAIGVPATLIYLTLLSSMLFSSGWPLPEEQDEPQEVQELFAKAKEYRQRKGTHMLSQAATYATIVARLTALHRAGWRPRRNIQELARYAAHGAQFGQIGTADEISILRENGLTEATKRRIAELLPPTAMALWRAKCAHLDTLPPAKILPAPGESSEDFWLRWTQLAATHRLEPETFQEAINILGANQMDAYQALVERASS